MSMNDIREYEETYRNVLFGKIQQLISRQTELIINIDKMGRFVDLESGLPNIGITLHNKINELQNEFKKSGISMYACKNDETGFIDTPFLGTAIVYDLIEKGVWRMPRH